MKHILTITLSFLFFSQTFAQQFLSISEYGIKVKRHRIYLNEPLIFKTKHTKGLQKKIIRGFHDSLIIFGDSDVVNLKDIKVIYLERAKALDIMGNVGVRGGIFLVALDGFNNLINGERELFNPGVAKVAGSMVLAGIVFKVLNIKRIRPGKNKILKIMDLRI